MKRRGHNLRLGIGAVAVGGTLGIMIPPSNYFILYGVLTETSITKLFMAGVVPGLMIVCVVLLFNTILFKFRPHLSPATETEAVPTWPQKWMALRRAWTGVVLIVTVVGGIFLGVVTPTEAGGLGAVIALLIGTFFLKSITRRTFSEILIQAVQMTSMMGFIIFGGMILARASTMMNLSTWLISLITESGLGPWTVMLLINLLLLVLGMFMDAAAITILTVPLLFPVIVALGFDPIWFGVVVALNMELALVTPPVGLNIFVLKAVADVSLRDAVAGTMPYTALLFICLGLLMAFPQIALWLPGLAQ
jgi:C4-dicarboxylate transporter DctM subunit